MSPQLSPDNPSSAATDAVNGTTGNPTSWRFTWEAQSHAPTLRLLLFNPNIKPPARWGDPKVSFIPQQSLIAVSILESDDQMATLLRVPVPRVLIDPESPPQVRAFDDHIEVKLVLLLPVDHPLVSDFDSIPNDEENVNELQPLSVDYDSKKLSCLEEVHFYCRNCSSKLTKGIRYFKEMPSLDWRDVADNWFGNCCCSFGGVSEELVAKYVKSYACTPGLCLLNTTSVLLSKNDFLGYEFPDSMTRKKNGLDLGPLEDNCSSKVSPAELHMQERAGSSGIHNEEVHSVDRVVDFHYTEDSIAGHVESGTLENVVDDSLSGILCELHLQENGDRVNGKGGKTQTGCCHSEFCSLDKPGTSFTEQMSKANGEELLGNQRAFLDGYLGNGFMLRSFGLSKDVQWVEFLCPDCSCLIGAYPCSDNNAPLDGGVRLFKCYISTCLPSGGSDDAFRKYTLERMFGSRLLESAEDELSYRTVVRDMQTRAPMLQIVLLNPNSWGCARSLHQTEPTVKLVMHPIIKLLFSTSFQGMEFDSVTLEDWVEKNQADEIYMFSSQIREIIRVLQLANSLSPPSCASLQGLFLSTIRR